MRHSLESKPESLKRGTNTGTHRVSPLTCSVNRAQAALLTRLRESGAASRSARVGESFESAADCPSACNPDPSVACPLVARASKQAGFFPSARRPALAHASEFVATSSCCLTPAAQVAILRCG